MSKYLFHGSYTEEGLKGLLKEGGSKRREAADQMAQRSPQHWAVRGLHLLKALDVRVTGGQFPAALRAIRSSIDLRLDTGQWEEESLD